MQEGQAVPAGTAITPFVGRTRDLAELRAALDAAVAGSGSLVLVAGEPGIGKTRLAEQVAAEAATRGVVALWGRAWAESEGVSAPAFWPWIQVVRQLLRRTLRAGHGEEPGGNGSLAAALALDGGSGGTAALAAEDLDPGVAAVVRLVPELARRVPEPAELAALAPKEARFRLLDGAARLLAAASAATPLLVVLDDLHRADAGSLELLRFVARELHGVRLLLLGTYRDAEAVQAGPGAIERLAADLGASCQHLSLRGLDLEEVNELLALTSGMVPSAALGVAVLERTGGNPLFVREIARLLAAGLPGTAVPEGVQAVLRQRLGLLSPECGDLLAVASVLGREPPLELLRTLAGRSIAETLELLGEAISARLIEEVPGGAPCWRFTHTLVREVLYADLPPARRLALHLRAGETIEALRGPDLDDHLVEVADHFLRAGPPGAAKAVAYSARAGHRALGLTAWEEAAGHLRRALDTLDLVPIAAAAAAGDGWAAATERDARRCELELALAEARMAVGEVASARAGYERAAALARRLGSAEQLAGAALGLGAEDIVFAVDELQIRLLEEALHLLGDDGPPPLRAKVLARLARALLYTQETRRRTELCQQAVAIARRAGDQATLAAVLSDCHTATQGLEGSARRLLDTASEIVALAEGVGDRVLALQGRALRAVDLLELGDVAAMRADTEAYERGALALRQPHLLWPALVLRANLAIIDGRFDEAKQLIKEALAVGRRAGDPAAVSTNVGFRGVLGLVMGDFAALEGMFREVVARMPVFPMRIALTLTLTLAGKAAEAAEEFERLAGNRFALLPRDSTYLLSLALAALTACGLGDSARAAALYALLLPYDGQVVRVSRVGGGCLSPVSRYLGLLAATMGRFDQALTHFDAAIELEERMGALPYLATSRYYHALALGSRGRPGDEERARSKLNEALVLLRRFGVRPLFAPPDLLDAAVDTATTAAGSEAAWLAARQRAAGAAVGVLRREGEYWAVGWQGSTFRLRDTVGLAYLARLLADPNREWHALDLASSAASDGSSAVPAVGGGHALRQERPGPLLDEQAKRAYRERLRELEEELAEAEGWHDQHRAARARAEREALARQLRSATGLGGRDRSAGRGAAERARVSVTKALRGVIHRIAEHDPALGTHLDRSIRTGTFCSYSPDPNQPVTWEL